MTQDAAQLAQHWYEQFSRHAEDLYPGRYTPQLCRELAERAVEIRALARERGSTIVAHNYLYPEFHELADMVGDSLGLSLHVREIGAPRVEYQSVFFMAATAKIITGDRTRVYVPDHPEPLGCSLVFGTDHAWLERWKAKNPGGVMVTYINSDAYTKSLCDYVSTSRNTDKIIVRALLDNPDAKVLVLPDKFLGHVMKQRALDSLQEQGTTVDPDRVEIYEHRVGEWNACCYVHEQIGEHAVDHMLEEHPEAELMIHPECGCASSCLYKLHAGVIPRARAYFLSTEGMVERARQSDRKQFIVATEKGMVYRLRKELPEKEFIPVSLQAECRYMKVNQLDKLAASLRNEAVEVVICDDCCDPRAPFEDEHTVHIPRSVADKARTGIERMLSIA